MAKLKQMVARVAPLDTSVLVLGESGTGKELVARALQRQIQRAAKPSSRSTARRSPKRFSKASSSAMKKALSRERIAQKKGKLELGEGGTIFLDEIGELAAPLQAKMLRVLQQREFERVGGTVTHKLDVRLIAATNRDLAAAKSGAARFARIFIIA